MTGAGAPVDLLVIDAVAARHGSYRDLLGGLARQVVTVVPGDAARERLRTGDFAAVLLHLDDTDGRGPSDDLAGILASRDGQCSPPVIVISARAPDLDAAGFAAPGLLAYVPAAFTAELIPERVSCLIELARVRGELARRDEQIGVLAHQLEQLMAAAAEERNTSDVLRARVGEQIHRSKNLITILQSVARRTISNGRDISESREALMGRLRALARAYHLITSADGAGTEISAVVEAELADVSPRVTASGPSARLAGSVVQTFALALHELAVNAVKHGALRSPDGSIAVGWTFFEHGSDRYLEVAWTERGGPPPKVPSQYGFGLTLVSSFARPGGVTPNITFDTGGLACRMRLPQEVIVAG